MRLTHPTLYRLYLLLMLSHTIEGLLTIYYSQRFNSPAFNTIKSLAPIRAWGVLAIVAGIHIAVGILLKRTRFYRAGAALCFVYNSMFALSFMYSFYLGTLMSPSAVIKWVAFSIGCLIILREPPVNLVTSRRKGHRHEQ